MRKWKNPDLSLPCNRSLKHPGYLGIQSVEQPENAVSVRLTGLEGTFAVSTPDQIMIMADRLLSARNDRVIHPAQFYKNNGCVTSALPGHLCFYLQPLVFLF